VALVGDVTPAPIAEHPFTAVLGQEWGRCLICKLAAPAHLRARVSSLYEPPAELPYRCPDCVMRSEVDRQIVVCSHREGA